MDKSAKKKAAASAVAAVTAAGVLVGGAFSSPADIMDDGPDMLVQTVDMESQTDSADSGGEGGEDDEKGVYASVRRLVRQSPAPVRALVAVPLWLLGSFVIWLAGGFWSALLSPVFSAVLGWAAVGLMALVIYVLAVKTVAPDMPLKKILNKGSVLGIVLLSMAFGLLDSVLPLFWEAYDKFSDYLRLVGSGICALVPIAFFLRRHKRKLRQMRERELARREELELRERERQARKLIEELADSVCAGS